MDGLHIRTATVGDLEAINDIYNYYVLTSTATYQVKPESLDARRAWFDAHDILHPVVVAEENGQILGWGSLSRVSAREAYDRTVENSVYIDHEHHRRGIGAAILADLVRRARETGHHTIIAGIDSEQEPSLALHERFGFVRVARFREVGYKFGRWLDRIDMQLML
jgi:phosphinothricin acetyltransferase